MENSMFIWTITEPKGNAYLMPMFLIMSFLVLIGAMVGIIFSLRNTTISINDNEIVIKSFLYGRRIPIENIKVNEIRHINLNMDKEFNVSIRTNGIGLPNFLSGWMKLNNGNKALVFLTDRDDVLLIPTKDFILLFSMKNQYEFIEKMKNILRI